MLTIKERCENGAKALRSAGYITWYQDIKQDKLSGDDIDQGILGQLYRTEMRCGWAVGTRILYGECVNRELLAAADGFAAVDGEADALRDEWLKLITEKLEDAKSLYRSVV